MKTAIIGLGPHGKRLIDVVRRIPELELTAVADKRDLVLDEVNENGIVKFESPKDMYHSIKPEVVLIATNGPSHATLAIEAMENGARYVMVEKPMACSVKECREMEEFARKYGVRLSVDKKNRHDPLIQFLKEKVDSGKWGRMRSVYIQIPGIGLGCLATHWIDVANFLVGHFPRKVSAWIDSPKGINPRGELFVDPGGLVIMDYGNELRGIVSQIEDGSGPMTIEIHCTAARVFFDPKFSMLHIVERDLSIKPGPGKPPAYSILEPPPYLNIKGDMIEQMVSVVKELISDKPMLTDASFGTAAIEILSAAYASSENGNIPISLPLKDESMINRYMPIT